MWGQPLQASVTVSLAVYWPVVGAVLPVALLKLKTRLELSKAKHPSLRGHSRMALEEMYSSGNRPWALWEKKHEPGPAMPVLEQPLVVS